ncbi:uncharacterized protein J3D65DRAFT_678282, partial [Phyllosticta citribraziliensis]
AAKLGEAWPRAGPPRAHQQQHSAIVILQSSVAGCRRPFPIVLPVCSQQDEWPAFACRPNNEAASCRGALRHLALLTTFLLSCFPSCFRCPFPKGANRLDPRNPSRRWQSYKSRRPVRCARPRALRVLTAAAHRSRLASHCTHHTCPRIPLEPTGLALDTSVLSYSRTA